MSFTHTEFPPKRGLIKLIKKNNKKINRMLRARKSDIIARMEKGCKSI